MSDWFAADWWDDDWIGQDGEIETTEIPPAGRSGLRRRRSLTSPLGILVKAELP